MTEVHYREGADAFARGALRSACPYRYGSPACEEWSEGWVAAMKAKQHGEAPSDLAPKPYDPHPEPEANALQAGLEPADRAVLSPPKRW
ncbi:hypothetical protein [Aureimonas sp. ME7]|uniref:hypothetical protein n=1 Tax=Aureimonas sp. ME7 TaxID=2744252 RepID=UPI0015F46C48|nr:hypothetical protein [Aureimonas sp. ME7]